MLLMGNAHLEIEPDFQGSAHIFGPQGPGLNQALCSIASCDVHEPCHAGRCGQALVAAQRGSSQCTVHTASYFVLIYLKHYVWCFKIFIWLCGFLAAAHRLSCP